MLAAQSTSFLLPFYVIGLFEAIQKFNSFAILKMSIITMKWK